MGYTLIVTLAGDLFEKRTVDPLAMRVAIEGFRWLREAGISVIAGEGNHEKTYYRDQYSWVDFLDGLGYLHLSRLKTWRWQGNVRLFGATESPLETQAGQRPHQRSGRIE